MKWNIKWNFSFLELCGHFPGFTDAIPMLDLFSYHSFILVVALLCGGIIFVLSYKITSELQLTSVKIFCAVAGCGIFISNLLWVFYSFYCWFVDQLLSFLSFLSLFLSLFICWCVLWMALSLFCICLLLVASFDKNFVQFECCIFQWLTHSIRLYMPLLTNHHPISLSPCFWRRWFPFRSSLFSFVQRIWRGRGTVLVFNCLTELFQALPTEKSTTSGDHYF